MKKYIAVFAIMFAVTSNAYSQAEPPYGMSELQAYSIFYENYRTGSYDMALQFGKWMLEAQPRSIEGANRFSLPRQYERMINVYTELSKQETDPSISSAYLDTVQTIYTEAFEIFSEDEIDYYDWHFNKGRFYQENQSNISNGMDKAYEEYEKAYELDPERLAQAGDGYYINILLSNYVSKDERDKALAMIDEVEQFAGDSLMNQINEIRDGLFSDPEERIKFLEGRLADNPGDIALLKEIANLYEDQDNQEKAIDYARQIFEAEQNFENAKRLAEYAQSAGERSQALNFWQQALDLAETNSQQKTAIIQLAEINQNLGNLQEARRLVRRGLQLDRNWGEAYIKIADIYAAAIRQCTSGRPMERDDRAVYWLVLDYLDRARNADPSVANAVQRQYRTYEPVTPTAEDKFFRGWETGDEIQIDSSISDCYAWINETTTVR
ncbi:tetratricopeptide repeat protein [Rhodohalobacter sp.]|uniref:tetratricopeptide repeat protein n=1 Tax=Rhodohalobacter sp. TaxID=1974210 RepID=UPI002ACE1330|nr:tetratricopeptide repeat protein [Rhodohalobacter sp.]MDZ7755734.1 tetratricopeptide repeat protein [Rhodohalobacter sp.]